MTNTNRPTIKLELGISTDARPSLSDLRRRARNRTEFVASGQPDLAFLIEGDFPETGQLEILDGGYVLVGPVPRIIQNRLDLGSESGTETTCATRDDAADEMDIKSVVQAVALNSTLLAQVARLMAVSPAPVEEIRLLERRTGIDTRLMRRFVYEKQEDFDVTVDSERIRFKAVPARTAVTVGDPIEVLLTPVRPRLEGRVMRGRVDATVGDGRNGGIQKPGECEFRFGRLEPWQSAAIELAHQLGKKILVTAVETSSTCSLQSLPADIQAVHNWAALLNLGLAELSKAANEILAQNGDDFDVPVA